ncbi:MAG TPA: S1C family serine protease [Verrucomicrobiales bacterium]|nr:S1C family serine protease [Verrucomicrobiales bacterium]
MNTKMNTLFRRFPDCGKIRVFLSVACSFLFAGHWASALTLEELKEQERMVQTLAEQAIPATVALLSERHRASGSGVVISADGMVLTAGHVIQGSDAVLVVFPDGRTVRGKTLGRNLSRDVGMVKIVDEGPFPFVDLAPPGSLEQTEIVIAMGHPGGFDPSRTPPLRIGRILSQDDDGYVWTDCALIGGDSGGPLYDLEGRVVGIHSSIGGELSQNRHASTDAFHEDWDRFVAGDSWGSLGMRPLRAGDPNRPVVGIELSAQPGEALRVDRVVENGPGEGAGMAPGDIITSVDGRKVEGYEALQDLLGSRDAGDEVVLGLERSGQELSVTLKLARAGDLDPSLDQRGGRDRRGRGWEERRRERDRE